MASARKDSKKRLNAKLRKINNDLVRVQEKACYLRNQIKDSKEVYDKAMSNSEYALRELDYKVSREQREREWKNKMMRSSDANKRDVKWLTQQVGYLRDKILNEKPPPSVLENIVTIDMIKKALVYGFGLTFGLGVGLATTAMPN